MSDALHGRLFDTLREPRGHAALTMMLGVTAGISFRLAAGSLTADIMSILATVGFALLSIGGALGVAFPERFAVFERQPTWSVVASLVAIGLFVLSAWLSL